MWEWRSLIRSRRLALLETEGKSICTVSVTNLLQFFLEHICLNKKLGQYKDYLQSYEKNHITIRIKAVCRLSIAKVKRFYWQRISQVFHATAGMACSMLTTHSFIYLSIHSFTYPLNRYRTRYCSYKEDYVTVSFFKEHTECWCIWMCK